MTRRSARLSSQLLLLLLGGAVGFLAAEALVRLSGQISKPLGKQLAEFDVLAAKIEPHGELGFRPKADVRFEYFNGTVATTNDMGFRGPVVAVPKPDSVTRIILLGGSTTHGWGVNDDETIDAHLRWILRSRYPDRLFEVVNLAFDAYDSYQLFERLRSDGTNLQPDLVVINSGINDVRNARHPDLRDRDRRTLIYEDVLAVQREIARRGGPGLWLRIKHVSWAARLPGLVRGSVEQRQIEEAMPRSSPNPQAIDYFERNLWRSAKLLEENKVPVVLSTPPSSLNTRYAPGDTSPIPYWLSDAATTQAYRDSLAMRMQKVATAMAEKGYPVAYASVDIPRDMFLDDCHLSSAGNQRMANGLLSVLKPFIE